MNSTYHWTQLEGTEFSLGVVVPVSHECMVGVTNSHAQLLCNVLLAWTWFKLDFPVSCYDQITCIYFASVWGVRILFRQGNASTTEVLFQDFLFTSPYIGPACLPEPDHHITLTPILRNFARDDLERRKAAGSKLFSYFTCLYTTTHVYIITYLFTSRDNKSENLGETTVLTCKMSASSFRPSSKTLNILNRSP